MNKPTLLLIGLLPLMPWPASVSPQQGAVVIDSSFSVSFAGEGANDARVGAAVMRFYTRLARETGIPITPHVTHDGQGATLSVVVEQKDHRPPQRLGDDESYALSVGDGHIKLAADRPLGVLRGMQTLLQLVQQDGAAGEVSGRGGFSFPAVTIRDQPRFAWRGLSLDVSRHFIPIENVKRTIDALEAVKLNVLHWHLSDDQGFRVESRKYPHLQQHGSDGLYYRQAEIRDVIAYARERGVRIVPEFDMPGHSASWFPGYPRLASGKPPFEIWHTYGISRAVMDPTQEYTYRFLDGFIGEMTRLFPDEYFHIGGDEVDPTEWNSNARIRAFMAAHRFVDPPALHAYFNQRLQKMVARHGKRMEGWDEVLHPGLPKSIVIQSWRGQQSLWQAARQGYQCLLSRGYYLDLMYPASYHYSIDPMKVPHPAPGEEAEQRASGPPPGSPADLTPEQQRFVLGGEATMWEELATAENLDAKLWPRLAAIAERFWSPESTTDATSMYQRLETTNDWLEWLGLTQRSNLALMRRRLAGSMPVGPLDEFAEVLESVKGYGRNADKYSTNTPLNRLIDSIPPESDAAREFRKGVDEYLAASREKRSSDGLRGDLTRWATAVSAARPMLQQNSLLTEDIPVADGVERLCQAGLEALSYLDSGKTASADWKQKNMATTGQYTNRRASDFLIQIAPGVEKLVDAVAVSAQ